VGIHQRGKSNSIRDLLVRIARQEHLEVSEGDATPFSAYASAWLERKKATLARSTYGDYHSIWKKYVLPCFGIRCNIVREGRVLGIEGPPKTMSSHRDVDMLDPLFEALRKHRLEARAGSTYVFSGNTGRPLEVNNLRNRIWYPAIAAAGLRRRTMYQTRHTFASLMLGHGEDPLWVARMLGHTGLDMIFKHYGKFIRNRSRKDGGRFLEGLKEAEASADGKA